MPRRRVLRRKPDLFVREYPRIADAAARLARETEIAPTALSKRTAHAHPRGMRTLIGVLAFGLLLSPSLAFARYRGPHDAPPPRREEVARPRGGYVWTGGHYGWRNNRYEWSRGRYLRERHGYGWRDGTWESRDDRYEWHPGRWERGR